MKTSSKTTLRPIVLHDDPPAAPTNPAPATNAPAAPPASGGNNPQNPTPQGAPPASGGNNPQQAGNTPPATPDPNAEPTITLTESQLTQRIQAGVTAALRDHQTREARAAARRATAAARQTAEASGDQAALAEVERTEAQQARDDLANAERERDAARRELAVTKVAARYGLDADLTELLVNNSTVTDEATADAAAKKLAQFKKTPPAPPTDAGGANRPQAKPPAGAQGKGNGPGAQAPAAPNGDGRQFSFTSPTDVPWPK